jgi:membrane associated rhomboid family serine protease
LDFDSYLVSVPDDSDYESVSERRAGLRGPATIALIVVNVIVYYGCQLFAQRFHPDFPVDNYFALSLDGLRHGYLWQLLTFQFMHGGFWHILFNSWAIFVFGRVVEVTIGKRRMLELYFLSGVMGGLVQMLGTWLWPSLFGDAGVVGASAGAFGLVAAFAVLYPSQKLYLLLFLIIPLRMRATTLLWVSVAFALFGIMFPYLAPHVPGYLRLDDLFGNVAHAAHLGGIITGFLFARQLVRNHRRSAPPVVRPPVIHSPEVKSSLNINPASE